MPSVTAILPCYNHSKYLKKRIDSVINQTLNVDEVVFLDDASSDTSVELAKRALSAFSGKIVFVTSEANSGSPFIQWNRGVEIATSEFIWIAETDDLCSNNFLEEVLSAILTANCSLGFSDSILIDESGKEFGHTQQIFRKSLAKIEANRSINGSELIRDVLCSENLLCNASAIVFSRDSYIKAGGAPESFRYCGDWLTWIRLLGNSKAVYISRQLNYFRFHSSTTRSKPKSTLYKQEEAICVLTAARSQSSLWSFSRVVANSISISILVSLTEKQLAENGIYLDKKVYLLMLLQKLYMLIPKAARSMRRCLIAFKSKHKMLGFS
jgi:glycosyltransferase involved in cell wall biosynthesis